MTTQGSLITIDGLDGSGKSTQVGLLLDHLLSIGRSAISVRDLDDSQIGTSVRTLINRETSGDVLSDMLLVYVARLNNIRTNIMPAIERGDVVIADRFSLTTRAYNVEAAGASSLVHAACEKEISHRVQPALSIVLDVTPEMAMQRLAARGDPQEKYEARGESFFRQVRNAFHRIAHEKYAILVDGAGPSEAIAAQIRGHVFGVLGG